LPSAPIGPTRGAPGRPRALAGMSWGPNGGWTPSKDEYQLKGAVPEVAAAIAPLETEWDAEKLEKKICEYFKKAAKNLQFHRRPLADAINEYTDKAVFALFAGLGDREWLKSGQADFLVCVDAAIKDYFPPLMFRNVQQLDFEQLVLAAYDRAFEEQRFGPILTDAVNQHVSGPKIKKKVWYACDAGRKEAAAAGVDNADEFTLQWIGGTVRSLSAASFGSPEDTMTAELCTSLFTSLLEGGALPVALTEEGDLPVHLVDEAVANAYAEHSAPEEAAESGPPAKKRKGGWSAGY